MTIRTRYCIIDNVRRAQEKKPPTERRGNTMKNTMQDIINKYYYIDIADLWDEIAERKNMRKATEEEVAEVFANEYNVDVEEVMEYFL